MSRQDLLFALAVGMALVGVALAVYVVVDDQVMRRQLKGRWARLDQALVDAEENAALVRASLQPQREQAEGSEGA